MDKYYRKDHFLKIGGQRAEGEDLLLGTENEKPVYVQSNGTKRLKVNDDEVEVMTGDFKVTSGDMTMTDGDLTLTTGNLILSAGTVVSTTDKSSIQIYKDPNEGDIASPSGLVSGTAYDWPTTHMVKSTGSATNMDTDTDNWVTLIPAETQKLLFVWNATISLTGTSGTYKDVRLCFRQGSTCTIHSKIECEVNSSRWTSVGGSFVLNVVGDDQEWIPVFNILDSISSSVTMEFKSYQITVTQL